MQKARSSTTNSQETQVSKRSPNPNDVLIRIIDSIYNLLSSGNLFGFALLAAISFLFYLAYKMPAEYLHSYVLNAISFLISEKFYLLPLVILLFFSLLANFVQAIVFKREINRLAAHRRFLVHGLRKGELKRISPHASSRSDRTKGRD